ncbi:PqqD family protein [Prescottella agglutinans]|uniref:PqqD family protein n=1 Tax=Prescottella agglutinans TaxID=1644129 RepID=UPI003D983C89
MLRSGQRRSGDAHSAGGRRPRFSSCRGSSGIGAGLSYVALHPSVSFSAADGGGILLDRRDGRYFRLNVSATSILEEIVKAPGRRADVRAVVSSMQAIYDVDARDLEVDVNQLFDFLTENHLGESN